MDKKRSTRELIAELDHEGANFTCCALVVGFENTTMFVWSNDPDRQNILDKAVVCGGQPVGMIDYDLHNGFVDLHTFALEEYAGEEWVAVYLDTLSEKFKQSLVEQSGAQQIESPQGLH